MNLKELFDHIKKEHGLYLTESEIKEIAIICREIEDTRECYNCKEEVTMVSNGYICPNCYKEQ